MKVWKYYTIKGAIVIIENDVKAIKSKTINNCWRKLHADVDDFTGFTTELVKEIMKKTGCGKNMEDDGFQDTNLGGIQELIDTTPEESTEDDLMVMSGSKPVPDNKEGDIKEAMPENKLISNSLAEAFQLFKTAFNFFHDWAQSLKTK